MSGSYYNDKNLQDLFAALSPDQRKKALKGAMRKMANKVKKVAVANVKKSLHAENKDNPLGKGIRALTFKKVLGFRITVGTTKRKGKLYGYHVNRKKKELPILMWAELGTKNRTVKSLTIWKTSKDSKKTRKVRREWVRIKASRGAMPKMGFIGKTLNQVRPTVTSESHKLIAEKVREIAKKYGCK